MNVNLSTVRQYINIRKQAGLSNTTSLYQELETSLEKCTTLQARIQDSDWDESLKEQGRRNYLVNTVSILEGLLKDLIIQYHGNWKQEGLNSLLKEKISLGEAFDLFADRPVSKEVIVARFSSFQNIESIDKLFSCLTGKNFYAELNSFSEAVERAKSCKDFLLFTVHRMPDWKTHLNAMFVKRHEIVHEPALQTAVQEDQLTTMTEAVMRLAGTITRYFEHRFGTPKSVTP